MTTEPRRPLLTRGARACIPESDLRGAPARPGTTVRVERGSWGFEIVISSLHSAAAERTYFGEVTDVWGDVPCA